MSTATADPVTKAVTFIAARCPNLVLVRRAARTRTDEAGNRVHVNYDEWINQQEDINFTLIQRGEEPREIDRTPWRAEFENGTFTTEDQNLIDWLRNHKLFNNVERGFYERGNAPDEPKPTMSQQTEAIGEASAIGDLERLEEILALEKDTHNREPVLVAAEAAISGIRKLEAQMGSGAGADGDHESRAAHDPPQ